VNYTRHLALPDFSPESQKKVTNAHVLVIGAGGLGVPVAAYLAASGVGRITVLDFDCIDESNLHRQVAYGIADVGKPKVSVLCDQLQSRYPHLRIHAVHEKFHLYNCLDFIRDTTLVIDASDRFAVRFLACDACAELQVPLLTAAVTAYEGQWALFLNQPGAVNYRDLFLSAPGGEAIGNCETNGVLGTAAGVLGTLAANTALRFLAGLKVSTHVLHVFNTADLSLVHINVQQNPENPLRRDNYSFGLLKNEYEELCMSDQVEEVDGEELRLWLQNLENVVLVDVRTTPERDQFHIGGLHIALHEFASRHTEIPQGKSVVLYCQKGIRSWDAAAYLKMYRPEQPVFSLRGGMVSWVATKGM
jgi:molybdopterin/thiamine biosynthesis adenylyltransferase/rhodanese-related sulfurtransferase